MKHHTAMKMNELLLHKIISINLTDIMLKERRETQKCIVYDLIFRELKNRQTQLTVLEAQVVLT